MPLEVAPYRARDQEEHPALSLGHYPIQPAVASVETQIDGLQIMETPEAEKSVDTAETALECIIKERQPAGWSGSINGLHQLISRCEAARVPETLRFSRKPAQESKLRTRARRRGTVVHLRGFTRRKPAPKSNVPANELLQASLNALSAQVVIVDATGTVVASNRAWERFAAGNRLASLHVGRRTSYQSLYNEWRTYCPQVDALEGGVASVLAGHRNQARGRYQWRTEGEARWFDFKASRYDYGDETYVIIINEDVTRAVEGEHALGQAAENLLRLQEREREIIAQELHDSTAQHIVAAALNLVGLRAKLEQRPDVLECLQRIEGSLDEACKELRSFTYLLHPPCLEEDGLAAAVQRYVEGFAARTGVQAKTAISSSSDCLPIMLRRSILRVVQEALGNVHRHASATQVTVALRCIHGGVHLLIQDNGRGIGHNRTRRWQTAEPAGAGVGISGIRARLRQFGGALVVKSGARGTMLHAAVPVRPDAALMNIALRRLPPHVFGVLPM